MNDKTNTPSPVEISMGHPCRYCDSGAPKVSCPCHRYQAPAELVVGSEPVAEIVEATSPAAELIFGRDITLFEALRTLPIGTKLYAVPPSVGGGRHQRIFGILDDFAEMQPEEDEDWESWYHASFDLARQKIRAALSSPMGGGDNG